MPDFIRFECPNCRRKLKHRTAGSRVTCVQCGNVMTVPEPARPAEPAAPDDTPGSRFPKPAVLGLFAAGFLCVSCLLSVVGFAAAAPVFGGFFLLTTLVLGGVGSKVLYDLATRAGNGPGQRLEARSRAGRESPRW